MKLTFTCPDCGTLIQESDIAMTEYSGHWGFEDILTCPKCQRCADLTYGALTEEMVAEALFVAGHQWARDRCDAGEPILGACDPYLQGRRMDMARFVLRLLNALGNKQRISPDGTEFKKLPWDFRKAEPGTTWAEWLLDMARKP